VLCALRTAGTSDACEQPFYTTARQKPLLGARGKTIILQKMGWIAFASALEMADAETATSGGFE
jgi:hypothetical protein